MVRVPAVGSVSSESASGRVCLQTIALDLFDQRQATSIDKFINNRRAD
jgi:hypothetical protein